MNPQYIVIHRSFAKDNGEQDVQLNTIARKHEGLD
jgi:hypothetical protein